MPVSVWTARRASGIRAGITVSSVLVADGSPAEVLGVVDPLSAFCDAVGETGRFLVHLLASEQSHLADKFALRVPGDPFEDEALQSSAWGPALVNVSTRVACTLLTSSDAGYGQLLRGRIDELELDARATQPLVYYRGGYRTLRPLRG